MLAGGPAPGSTRSGSRWPWRFLAAALLATAGAGGFVCAGPGAHAAAAAAAAAAAGAAAIPYDRWQTLVPTESPTAASLEIAGYVMFAASCSVKGLLFWFLLARRRYCLIQSRIERRVRRPFLSAPLCIFTYVLLYELTLLPLSYSAYRLNRHFGLSVQSNGHWIADLLRGWVVNWLVLIPTLLLLLWLMRSVPRWWWLLAAVAVGAISAVMVYAAPLAIDPLFHRFRPLRDPSLRTAILNLADRAHIRISGVYVGQFSSTTTEGNAYVTGLGTSQRVVLWDTILKQYSPAELQSIVAHELGHYALHHIALGLMLSTIGSIFIFGVIALILDQASQRGRIRRPGEPSTVVPMAVIAIVLNYLALPVIGVTSRSMESQADAFSLRITARPDWFIRAMQHLSRQDYADPRPNPVVELIFYSHPSIAERIHMAVQYAQVHHIVLRRSLIPRS